MECAKIPTAYGQKLESQEKHYLVRTRMKDRERETLLVIVMDGADGAFEAPELPHSNTPVLLEQKSL